MNKMNFTDLGDEIKDIVQNAVSSRDFHQLNRDIGNTVNGALDEVRKALSPTQWDNSKDRTENFDQSNGNRQESFRFREKKQGQKQPNPHSMRKSQNEVRYQNQNKAPSVSKVTIPAVPIGKVSGTLLTVFGSIGASTLGIAIIVLSLVGRLTGLLDIFMSIVLGLSPLLFGSFFMLIKGSKIRKRVQRFRRYLGIMQGRNYCLIKDLTNNTGLSNKYVLKDLRKMISIGMFPEGHIDVQQTCFMVNRESYNQYLKLQESIRLQNLEMKNKKAFEQSTDSENSMDKELQVALQNGRSYILQIKESNDMIPEDTVSKKLDRLEEVTSKIFSYVELHPDQLPEIQKFMEYYLPTTLKLLNAYKEFDNQPVKGGNITTAKKEIADTLDTINLAFEKLLDSLFEDAAMDVSTDISVLETILAQEGLTKKDFNTSTTMGGRTDEY